MIVPKNQCCKSVFEVAVDTCIFKCIEQGDRETPAEDSLHLLVKLWKSSHYGQHLHDLSLSNVNKSVSNAWPTFGYSFSVMGSF